MPNSKIGIVGLIGLIIGFVVGYGMGRVSTGSPVNPLAGGSSYQDGYNAAKKKLVDSGQFPPSPTEATMLNGSISAIDKDSFTFEAHLGPQNPLEESTPPSTRTVTVASTTSITRQTAKSPDVFQKEIAVYQNANDTSKPAPLPYNLVPVKFSELKVGDNVTVTANHNILNEAAFTATEVSLNGAGGSAPPIAPPIAPPKP